MKVHPENVLVYSVVQKNSENFFKKIQNEKIYILDSCIILYAVAIWPVTCQGFQNTK